MDLKHVCIRPEPSRRTVWLMALPWIAVGLLIACNPTTTTSTKEKPFTIEKIEGSELSRITLTEKAAKRLGLETAAVRVEQVTRMRRVGGEVVRAASGSKAAQVRVALNRSDLVKVNRTQPARVMAMGLDDGEDNDGDAAELAEVNDKGETEAVSSVQYTVAGGKTKLTPGQRVFVELPLSAKVSRSVVPYTAVIYDLQGDTWVYTNPAPLTFVRDHVKVDYIDDDTAVLSEAPAVGTKVVSVGVAELFGTEFGVGK